eukprot:gene1473-biopygen21557
MVELHRMVTEAALMGAPIDLIAITESHLTKLIPDGEISLPGYQPPLRCDRDPAVSKHPDGRSRMSKGGVVVYVREGLLIQEVVTDAAESYELVAFTVANTRQLILYRPDPNLHCDKLHERLSTERSGRDRFICSGDFNANLDAKKPRGASLLRHLQYQLGLRQFVKFPTYHRCTKRGKLLQQSRIDHVWANINCRCAPQHSLIRESDHMGIRISYPARAKEEQLPRVVYRRQWRKIDADAAAEIIDRHMLPYAPDEELRPHRPEHAQEEMARHGVGNRVPPAPAVPQLIPSPCAAAQAHLHSVLRAWDAAWAEIKRTLVPKQRVRLPKPGTKKLAWVSKATRAKQRERNRCQRKFAKNFHDEEARRAVHEARAAVRKGLEEDAQSFIQGKWAAAGRNPGRPEHWHIFNTFAGRKVRARVQPSCTPDACNQSFLNKIKRLREPLINSPAAAPARKDVPRMDHFQDITPAQAMEALRASKPKTSSGIDEIPMTAVKQVGSRVPHYVALLANAVLRAQKWPEQWKRAQVSPLWKKKGCRQDPQNYRPLAMLPSISRVVERLFSEQLKAHIQAAGILPEFQHGFRKGYSCETALIDLINWVALARERGEQVVVVSADYSAAFDTLDHEVLIRKLDSQVGLHGPVLSLLDDYLNGRRQRTLIQGKPPSPWSAPVACGVPQGSVLGPLLFALYCVDIGAAVSGAKLIQYADDVTLCVSAGTIDAARDKMNAALEEFESFSKANRLVPQPAKTQLMVSTATRDQKRVQEFACELAQQKLRPAKAIQILGVLIDPGLTWAPHAAAAAGRADGATAAIRRNAGWLSVKDRMFLARALSLPYIDYCQTAMEGASTAAINSLQRAYHRAARMACRMERHSFRRRAPVATERSEAALRRTGWPTWPRRRRAAAAAMACKIWYSGEPPTLRACLPGLIQGSSTRSAGRRLPLKAHTHVVARKAFSVWARLLINRVLAGSTFAGCPPDISRPDADRAPRSGHAPPDEDLQERRNFYALIQDKYRTVREHSTPDGRAIAWTDGGCSSVHGTAVAGAGIYYGQGNERNCMRRVSGDQSSARAEVAAMLHVLETDDRRLRVATDNMYVCKGVRQWRLKWRQRAWFQCPLSAEEIRHADLWRRIDALLEERDADHVEVVWRKAHALQHHINAGKTTELDVHGNNMADQLATQAVANAAAGGPDRLTVPFPQLDLSDTSLSRAAALAAAADGGGCTEPVP